MATAIRQGETKDAHTEPCAWPTLESVEHAVREARRTVTGARYAAEDVAATASLGVRRHPLASVGLAIAAAVLRVSEPRRFSFGVVADSAMFRPCPNSL